MVDPGFSKVGGIKILDACCLQEHIYIITKTTRWEVVKNRPFFWSFMPFFPFSEHFQSKSWANIHFLCIILYFFSLVKNLGKILQDLAIFALARQDIAR